MAKTTKKQARETYDTFHSVLRNNNGGTKDENERMAKHCYTRLCEVVSIANDQAANPSKRLSDDEWLFGALKELPAKAWRFGVKYNLISVV